MVFAYVPVGQLVFVTHAPVVGFKKLDVHEVQTVALVHVAHKPVQL